MKRLMKAELYKFQHIGQSMAYSRTVLPSAQR